MPRYWKYERKFIKSIEQDGLLPHFQKSSDVLREMIEDLLRYERSCTGDSIGSCVTGRLIRLSILFGSGASFVVNDLNRALGRLGLKMAMDLAYSLKIPSMFPNKAGFLPRLLKYSLGLGVVASSLRREDSVKMRYLMRIWVV